MEPTLRMDSIGSLWSNAWKLYAERFDTMMGIMLPPILLIGLGNIFRAIGFPFGIAGSIISFVGVILSIIGTAALIYSLHHKTDFADSYRAGGKIFWPLLWIGILVAFAAIGSFVMLVIPGIWLCISLIFANFAVVLEGKRGMMALTQSREYIKSYWWSVFGRVVLLLTLLVVAYIVIGIPFAIVGGGVGRAISASIVGLFFAPFSIIYYYEMYKNLGTLKPHVRQGETHGGKTFIVVAQIVGIVCVILIAISIVASGMSGGWSSMHQMNPHMPGYYQGSV